MMRLKAWALGTVLLGLIAQPLAAQEPKRGGTLNFAVGAEPPNYDCHANTSFAFIHPVRPSYNTLLRFKADAYPAIEGDLAQSWEVAEDGLTYTFKLKQGVTFHDGTPFSAEDIKATYERIRNPQGGARSIRAAAYSDITNIEVSDPNTVVFKLGKPNASMLSMFASPWDCVYSAKKLAADPRFPEKNIMGTGPFVFGQHVAGSHWTSTRSPTYHEQGKPYLDGFRATFISGAPMINALAAGEIMAEFRGQSPAERDRVVRTLGAKAVVKESPWVCVLVVSFNVRKPPFDDARVRRALSIAIDRWGGAEALSRIALVKYVGGIMRPGSELAPSNAELEKLPGFSRDMVASRAEAKKLLADAGVSNLSFAFTNRNVAMPYTPVGVFLIDQWRQVGVNVRHEQLETRLYQDKLNGGDWQAGLDFACDFMDEPNLQLIKYISSDKSSINYTGSSDAKLDDLYERQVRAIDRAERAKLVREFEQHLLTEAYQFPTIWWNRTIVHNERMKGWHITPSHYLNQDLAGVWLDQ